MDRDAFEKLTERQKQCLRMVAAGKRSKTIGAALGISHLTVNQHIEAAKARLGAVTREQAAELLITHERQGHPERLTSEPGALAGAGFFDRIGVSPTPDDASPQTVLDVVMEEQAVYRATAFHVDDLLRLPLRTAERPRNDLSTLDTLFAIMKLIILLAVGAIAVAAIVETMTKIGTNLR
jgi:DNA-binding CsgD family transcriptional regulator